ncbi:BCS1 N terminal/ATPase family associated with various cellular activities (AAA), putative [Angomonas deanei]|uniref:BCS1 N terminal/ATPase family associated with various cellular activities (AAA), putative n=1 Tax=Angomonas deanei TaxID=59799 RepID=A0A7G2CU33_9TRYP|nr:BCS1 N terminal/ATPase family associated with various cellular activities (AAA), putative [Angomonas deanei]
MQFALGASAVNKEELPTLPENLELSALLPEGWDERAGPLGKALSGLLHNPYFSAGAGLWAMTVAGYFGRSFTSSCRTILRRQFLISFEVANTDSSFTVMERWIAQQPSLRSRQVTVSTQSFYGSGEADKLHFSPAPGVKHYFLFNRRPIWMTRVRNTRKDAEGEVFESMTFSTVGTSTALFEKMMRDAKDAEEGGRKKHTQVYTNNGTYWATQRKRAIRPLESVILPGDVSERLLADVQKFNSSVDYYRKLGVPYRRGYLLHGPPGCGKTSYVMALAGYLNMSISLLSLSSKSVNDENLMDLLNKVNDKSIILMEDIDRAFSAGSSVTMSGLLNALDGVGAQEGNIVFMTTNHVEKLDAALIRPGRVDLKVEIGLLDADQVRRMYLKFFPNATVDQQTRMTHQIKDLTMSAAQLQSHLFIQREDAEAAIRNLPQFIKDMKEFEKEMEMLRAAGRKTKDAVAAKAAAEDNEDEEDEL